MHFEGENEGAIAKSSKQLDIAWTECALVERLPGRYGGRPTKTPEETHESFPGVPLSTNEEIPEFAQHRQLVREARSARQILVNTIPAAVN